MALQPALASGAFVAYGSFASVLGVAVVAADAGTVPSAVCPVESRLVDSSCVACVVDCCQSYWYSDAFAVAAVDDDPSDAPFGVAAYPWNGHPSCHPCCPYWSPYCCSYFQP